MPVFIFQLLSIGVRLRDHSWMEYYLRKMDLEFWRGHWLE